MSDLPNRPLTRQRSPWIEIDTDRRKTAIDRLFEDLGLKVKLFRRAVSDGQLYAILGREPDVGLHLSVSWHPPDGVRINARAKRYPSWDELMHARWELLPHDVPFVMHFPTPEEYLAVHDTTFHLHEEKPDDRTMEKQEHAPIA